MSSATCFVVTQEQAHAFRAAGFLRLGPLMSADELSFIRGCCDRVLDEWIGRSSRFVSLAGEIPDSLTTVVSPEAIVPELKEAQFAQNARLAAATLLDCDPAALLMGWRLFLKPPDAHGTPWHQDAAYRPPPHLGASMFVPLDPMSESGHIRYLPGSHLDGLAEHRFEHGHFIAAAVPHTTPVLCPLEPGEASVHHCLTLHATGPNEAVRSRRALSIVFQPDGKEKCR